MFVTYRPAGRLDPFAMMNELLASQEAFFGGLQESGRTPATHVEDLEDRWLLHVDLPGLSPDAVKVETHDDQLTLTAERKLDVPEGYEVRRRERAEHRIRRSWRLGPDVNREAIEARFSDGVLTLSLPKQAPTRRAIPVAVASGKEN